MSAIGIDLGTSNSCVARLVAGAQPEILANRQGERTLPSVVSFLRDAGGRANVLVGTPAKRQAITNPRETVFGAKRLIGRRMDDRDVRRLATTLPYEVVAAPNGDAWVRAGDRVYSPQEISAHVLQALRVVAEDHLGRDRPLEAVITVPAYFDDAQRQATKDAAEIAGLRVRRLINEPTAAALGYGVHREPKARFVVCDLGGGTFDVSILNVEDGVFEVLATNGDNFLGGDDIDRRLVERLAQEIAEQHGLDVTSDPTALGRLRDEAEKVKWSLSEAGQSTIQLPYLGKVRGQVVNYLRILKRQELESFTHDIVNRLEAPCREAMTAAGLAASEIDQVLLVGGMTRMPAVQRKIEQIFGRRSTKNANPDETVAIGAATECAILAGHLTGVVLLDVTSRTLGLHVGQGQFAPVIPRNATLPTEGTRLVPTTQDGQRELAVEVYAGEAADVRRNRHLGTFVLGGLPDAPAGEVMVMVDFEVDVDGCLRVSARELSTGAQADVRLTATCGLARSEVRALAAERRA